MSATTSDPDEPFRPNTHWEVKIEGDHWGVLMGHKTEPCHEFRCPNQGRAFVWAGSSRWNTRHPKYQRVYCTEHMDGRWIENGQVFYWGLVDDEVVHG